MRGKIFNYKLKSLTAIILIVLSQKSFAMLATTGSLYLYNFDEGFSFSDSGENEVTFVHGVNGIFEINDFAQDRGASISYQNGRGYGNSIQLAAPTYDSFYNTNLGSQLESIFYNNAADIYSNSPTQPGFRLSGSEFGFSYNNESSFNVLEVEYGQADNILSLAVDFLTYSNQNIPEPEMFGSLRINSDLPLSAVPVPAAVWLLASGLIGLFGVAKRHGNKV